MLAIDAEQYNVWNNLGLLYEDLDDFPKAREAFQKTLQIDIQKISKESPANIRANFNLACIIFWKKQSAGPGLFVKKYYYRCTLQTKSPRRPGPGLALGSG
ncbi:MAG: tetratricopeptide repeat protein [Microscillaceae bacterium]|nr:tetratricopeptide repeat protein [Microscillaceae bacterium]